MKTHFQQKLLVIAIVLLVQSTNGLSTTIYSRSKVRLSSFKVDDDTLSASSSPSSSSSSSSWTDGGKVSVTVSKEIPSTVTSSEAVDAWIKHHWEKGGGLPIFIQANSQESSPGLKRVIYPVGMEEKLSITDQEYLEYTVSNAGPFFAELVPNSHKGTVTFDNNVMTWQVEFETIKLRGLYQRVTEFTIGVAARTVQEALQTSRLLTVKSTLPLPKASKDSEEDPIETVRREWLEFFWARGGGLPLPPPISYGKVLKDGGGTARTSILRVPPLLVDSILSSRYTPNESANVYYQIENPGWTTFPFLIHTHLGRVQFRKSSLSNAVDIEWQIEVRSFPFMRILVEKLLEMTASTIIRNLIVQLSEPNAILAINSSSFFTISKSTWLGGVLDALEQDERSTLDRCVSLVQPWTWGRSGEGNSDDNVTFEWTTGEIEQ